MQEASEIKVQDNDSIEVFENLKIIIYSLIGISVFLVPININGEISTLIYYLYSTIQYKFDDFIKLYIVIITTIGCLKPFFKIDKLSKRQRVLYSIRSFSIIIIIMAFYNKGPINFYEDDAITYIKYIVLKIGILLPLSSIFLSFLMEFGFLEFIEVYTRKFMNDNFKISGKSIINILVFFISDFLCGFFMLNNLYKKGKYNNKEAITIFCCFSLLSLNGCRFILDELNIVEYYRIQFFCSIVISLLVTMIIIRLWPIKYAKKTYINKEKYKYKTYRKDRFKNAIKEAKLKTRQNKSTIKIIADNLEEAFTINLNLIPDITIILFTGYILVNYTPIVDLLSYIFYPLLILLKVPDSIIVSKTSIISLFDPILAINSISATIGEFTRYIISIISISTIINLSTYIPCLINSLIPLNVKELVWISMQRIILSILLGSSMYYFFIGYTNI